ncbi:D-alanyl-D-alanine carboxypeptidase/D-alanyl-D-alanine-endopeptidase [Flavihumibacter petaseus]|uniref:Putative D-alanyl-D-alanine carboxypeptidase n=1 Tax=Flavihumibacter petaseus NBRC 106054 TaxID=1220578 RepID=A0A0E9N0J6_9BACT|nr:D-alanyl-D-alanine carboxypeptidase [Flavihumibacter petaseus]GAO42875.1 putative D-alanyl-D-alanine carboxypeptidase [Flavihumibacter petaseus NBRC 106054]
MRSQLLHWAVVLLSGTMLASCGTSKVWTKTANEQLLGKEGLQQAHVGICLYDADKNQYVYRYQSEKFFVPASNTKLMALYAGMKLLGDSIPAIRYTETADSLYLQPTGDPTFLHPDYPEQPLFDFLKAKEKKIVISDGNWQEKEFGYGWSWDDFNSAYMAERSSFPIYGNVIKWTQVREKTDDENGEAKEDIFVYSEPEVSWKLRFNPQSGNNFSVIRERYDNIFHVTEGKEILRSLEIPFVTNGLLSAMDLLRDTLNKTIVYVPATKSRPMQNVVYSRKADSVFSPMMHRSDNLFAEQCLLMLSDKLLGVMSTGKTIDTLLKSCFQGMPQPPVWVDGSGLSRYNQFSPEDFVWVVRKLYDDFSPERVNSILPAGNEGTLRGYYKEIGNNIHAKTGSLSGQLALSGLLKTKKGSRLYFSIIVNNHTGSATAVRRSMEAFLTKAYETY